MRTHNLKMVLELLESKKSFSKKCQQRSYNDREVISSFLGGGQGSFALPQNGKVYKMLLISKKLILKKMIGAPTLL